MTYCGTMRTRLLLLLALGLGLAPTPATAAAPPPVEVRAPNGARVTVDLRGEYLAGFSLLVAVTVHNDGTAPLQFPDLAARPHLVRFLLDGPKGKSERYSTPPATEPSTTWTIQPQSERRVLLEVPSSAAFPAGDWTLGLRILDPAGAVEVAPRPVVIAPARPVGGAPLWEATVASNTGAMMPWVHQARDGFDLYLMQHAAKRPDRVVAQYHLAHLDRAAEPVLTRARPSEAQSRFVYWISGEQALTYGRIEGTVLRSPRTIGIAYPKAELLGRGVTDGRGGLIVPLWVPAPSGSGGEVLAMCIDDRGQAVLRPVGRYTQRPAQVATAIDASSNLLLALAEPAGVAVFRVDPLAPPEMPARGARVWKTEGGWSPRALAFDTLPDNGQHPGGLSLLTVLSRPTGETAAARTLWADLSGRVFQDSTAGAWTLPGEVRALLTAGYGAWYALTQDTAGAWWYAAQNGTSTKVEASAPAALWPSSDAVLLRTLAPGTVVRDQAMGPRQP